MKDLYRVQGELLQARQLFSLCLAASEKLCGDLAAEDASIEIQDLCGSMLGGLITTKRILAGVDDLIDELRKGKEGAS